MPAMTHDVTPQSPPEAKPETPSLFERVRQVVERIRPAVQSDGGDLELVRVTDKGVAQIRLHGACVGCPSSQMTLQQGVERNIREKVPQVTAVEQVQ